MQVRVQRVCAWAQAQAQVLVLVRIWVRVQVQVQVRVQVQVQGDGFRTLQLLRLVAGATLWSRHIVVLIINFDSPSLLLQQHAL